MAQCINLLLGQRHLLLCQIPLLQGIFFEKISLVMTRYYLIMCFFLLFFLFLPCLQKILLNVALSHGFCHVLSFGLDFFFSKKECGLNRSCSWLDVVCVILQCQHISPEMFIQKFSCFASNFCILFGSIFNIYLISFSMTPYFQDANLMANINILLFCSIYEIAFNEYGCIHVYVHIFI